MKNVLLSALTALSLTSAHIALANEDKITQGYNSMDAMGCMLLRECTKDVEEVYSLLDISSQYDNTDEFTPLAQEFNAMLLAMHQVGIKVYLADERYFPSCIVVFITLYPTMCISTGSIWVNHIS